MEQPLYDTLRGNWNINRVIEDRRSAQSGQFTGIATFSGSGSTLLYAEDGTLSLADNEMRATRRYKWMIEGDAVTVTYTDDSPFHAFRINGPTATADHQCGDDFYYAKYSFYFPQEWQVVWTVSGPRKDYTSTTLYSR